MPSLEENKDEIKVISETNSTKVIFKTQFLRKSIFQKNFKNKVLQIFSKFINYLYLKNHIAKKEHFQKA